MRTGPLLAGFLPMVASGDGYYSTATLLEVLRSPQLAPEAAGYWLKFFPREITFDTEKIFFDAIEDGESRLAPFVAPNVQGRVIRSKGFETRSFKPAYLKPKHVVDPSRTVARLPGETPFNGLSRGQKYDLIVANNLKTERQMIENRWDWMACQAITTGMVLVTGEDYPVPATVDFLRDASLTTVLAGGAKWNTTTATPIADLQAARMRAFKLGRSPVNKVVMGLDAFAAFNDPSHTDVTRLLNSLILGNQSQFNSSNLGDGSPINFQGYLMGNGGVGKLEIYTYSNYYEGDDGIAVPYMDPGLVVGIGDAVQGVKAFGAIMDREANLQAEPMFPKLWHNDDPSLTYTMTQSAPLMVPLRPNNSFSIKVV